jgi:hypothetical protein
MHYISPLNTFMRKGKDPDPDRTSDYWIRIPEAQNMWIRIPNTVVLWCQGLVPPCAAEGGLPAALHFVSKILTLVKQRILIKQKNVVGDPQHLVHPRAEGGGPPPTQQGLRGYAPPPQDTQQFQGIVEDPTQWDVIKSILTFIEGGYLYRSIYT